MFTGIVQGKGKIISKRSVGGGMVFVVEADFELPDPVGAFVDFQTNGWGSR